MAREVAESRLGKANVETAFGVRTTDSDGRDALRITIVVRPEAVESVDGDDLLGVLVDLHARLRARGDDRLAIVHYATSDELADIGEP